MNRFWKLEAYPDGTDFASGIKLREEAIPEIGENQLLVRNLWLSLDAGTRMWLTPRTDSYMDPTPLGSKIIGFVLGQVVESRTPDIKQAISSAPMASGPTIASSIPTWATSGL